MSTDLDVNYDHSLHPNQSSSSTLEAGCDMIHNDCNRSSANIIYPDSQMPICSNLEPSASIINANSHPDSFKENDCIQSPSIESNNIHKDDWSQETISNESKISSSGCIDPNTICNEKMNQLEKLTDVENVNQAPSGNCSNLVDTERNEVYFIDNSSTINFNLPLEEGLDSINEVDSHNVVTNTINHIMVNTDRSIVNNCAWSLNDLSINSKGIYLLATLAGKYNAMLVDTGASISVMAKSVYDSMHKKHRPVLKPSKLKVCSVSGDAIKSYGCANIPMTISGKTYFPLFEIVDIPDKIILGMPIMTDMNGIIDMKANKVTLAGVNVPCVVLDGKPKPQRVLVGRVTAIEPGQEMIIPGYMGNATISPKVLKRINISNSTVPMLFEPSSNFCQKSGLIACPSVSMNRSKVAFRVFNPTGETIKLHKGAVCGFISPVEIESQVLEKTDQEPHERICKMQEASHKFENKVPDYLKPMYDEACEHLDNKSKRAVCDLLCKYKDIFSEGDYDIGCTNVVKHKIDTGDHRPIKQAPRRLPLSQQEEVDRQVDNLIKAGLIEPSDSSWASPVVLVRKKDGSQRMCCDYRLINACTLKDAHPLPRIDQSIDALHGMKWLCSLDLASGYYQVAMDEDAQEKSSFCTMNGLFRWRVMSFGLTNAPATFQRLMERVLRGLHWSILMVYLDDILVYGTSIEQVLARLEVVFQRLRAANLKLKPKKCHLFKKEVLFLGFLVGENGVHTDPAKIQAIKDFETPKSVQEVRQFLGITGYYRKFVKNYASISFPLNRLLDKNVLYNWDEDCDNAFQTLRQRLISAPILGLPAREGLMILDTDASKYGLGGVLSQVQNGQEVVLAYSSKAMSKQERQYCVTRQELLSIVYHIKQFKVYLWGRHFKVRTDHGSLKYLVSFKEPEGQLCRWLDALAEYDFEIITRAGKSHGNADFMSRGPCEGKKCFCTYSCSDPTLDDFEDQPCPLRQLECLYQNLERCVSASVDTGTISTEEVGVQCNLITTESECIDSQLQLSENDDDLQHVNTHHEYTTLHSENLGDLDPSVQSSIGDKALGVSSHAVQVIHHQTADKANSTSDINEFCPDISENDINITSINQLNVNSLTSETDDQYPFPWTTESMKMAQVNDVNIGPVLKLVVANEKPKWAEITHLSEESKNLIGSWNLLFVKDGLLYRKWIEDEPNCVLTQLVIPSLYRKPILQQLHDSVTAGHLGVHKVSSKILQHYFWPGLKDHVSWWIKTCLICQQKNNPQKKFCAPLQQSVMGTRFSRIALDIQGPLTETPRGNRYILVVSDYFSKWVEAYSMPDQTTETVTGIFVREWIARYGCPTYLHTDNGANLESAIMKSVCELLGIVKTHTVSRHPQSDGQVERFNRTVQQILAKIVEDRPFDWDLYLPFALMAYRSSKHESTGETPNKMLFGENVVLPIQAFTPDTPDKKEMNVPEFSLYIHKQLKYVHEKAYRFLQRAAEYQKKGYLSKLNHNLYQVTDSVWYWLPVCKKNQSPKLSSFWDGPYYIVAVYSDVLYRIQKSAKHKSRVVHHNQLKPCYLREQPDVSWVDKLQFENQNTGTKSNVDKAINVDIIKAPKLNHATAYYRPKRVSKPVSRYGDWLFDF